jgi:hypothetical protein
MRLPAWYKALWGGLLSLAVVVAVGFWIGAGAVRVGGVRIELDTDAPRQLLRIDDRMAFLVMPKFGQVSVVKYRRASWLLYPCGCYEPDGVIVNGVTHGVGHWVYTDHPGPPRFGADAVNLETGATLTVESKVEDADAATTPLYRREKLDFEPQHRIDPSALAKAHDTLFLQKESCVVALIAFAFVMALLLVLLPFCRLKR